MMSLPMNVYLVESMLLSFVMYASHHGVKHVTNSGINIQKRETTILRLNQSKCGTLRKSGISKSSANCRNAYV